MAADTEPRTSSQARRMIGTNTKMSLTPLGVRDYLVSLVAETAGIAGIEIFVLPPFIAIPWTADVLSGTGILWGAQDVFPVDVGTYTGEVSAPMLAELGCRYAMVGHFERRNGLGESNGLVGQKAAAAQRSGITPLVAIGEARRSSIDEAFDEVRAQIDALVDVDLSDVVFAYEPGWAIGVGAEAADDAWIGGMHARIRARLAESTVAPELVPIISGGSITAEAAPRLINLPDVDGLFVGRNARPARAFSEIIHSIQKATEHTP